MNSHKMNQTIIFELNQLESIRCKEFIQEHSTCPGGSMGDKFEVSFIPTGLGDCVAIRCLSCGIKKDITDTTKF